MLLAIGRAPGRQVPGIRTKAASAPLFYTKISPVGKPVMPPEPSQVWAFLPLGYLITVAIEVPILLVGLSGRIPVRHRLVAGLWLTACTYPVVVLVLPYLVWAPLGRAAYLAVAETFAPAAECVLFWAAYGRREDFLRRGMLRDMAAIVAANLASFLAGEWLF